MAVGGGALLSSARVLVYLFPPSSERFTGIKYFATALAVGSSSAPWLSSVAISHDSWRWIFGILIALAAIACVLSMMCLPTETPAPDLHTESHPALLTVLIAGTFVVLYALQRSYYDFYDDFTMLASAGLLGLLALGYFVHAMHGRKRALLDIRSLQNARYWSGVAVFTGCYVLMAATNYMLPVLLQGGLGFPWEVIGRVQATGLAATLLTWVVMATLLPKRPAAKKYYLVGFLALAIFGWRINAFSPSADLWTDFVPALASYGVFLMLVLATTAMHTFREVQHHETVISHAWQVKNMLAQFGGSLGISLATLGLQTRTAMHYSALNAHFVVGDPAYEQALRQMTEIYIQSGATQAKGLATVGLAQMLGQQATLLASLDYFCVVAGIGIIGAVVMVTQRVLK